MRRLLPINGLASACQQRSLDGLTVEPHLTTDTQAG
jgi:hypothetical protein